MFVISLDNEDKWFRFHHLFQVLVYDQLKSQLGDKMIEQTHYKASEWFEEHNLLEEAMYHAIEIQDFERASKIITEHRLELLNVDQWYVLEKLFSHLPESVVNSSIDLILVKAHIVFYHTDLVGLSEQVTKIEKLMGKIENPKELPYYGEFVFYQAHMYLFFQQDIAKTYELLSLAMDLVPESQAELRGRTELLFSLTAQMHGKYEEVYQKALLRDRSVRVNPVLRSRRFLNLMWLPMVAADPAKAGEYNIKLVNISRNDGQLVGIAWALYTSALIYLFKGLWKKAIVKLEKLRGMNYMWYTISEMDAMAALIIAYQLNGETEKAQKILKTLDRYASDMAPFYQSWLWAAKARYYRLTDDVEAIRQITVRQEVVSIGNPVYYYHVSVNVECQALIFEGSEASLLLAEEKLNGLITLCEDQNNILHWIELLIYKSILEYKKGMIEESVGTLMKAINLAEPGKLMVFFIEMGIPILKIVDAMSKEQREHPYLLEVVERIALTPFYNDKKVVKKKVIKEQLNILTASELKVLECVADGLRNQEIAEKLFNSEETIKKHVYNMFQKLNVKNRLSLVTKAKEEGILA